MSDDGCRTYPLTAADPYMPVRRSFARYVMPHLSGSAVKVYLHMLDDSYERVMVHNQLQWVFVTKPFSERDVARALDIARNSASSAIEALLDWKLIARVSPGTNTDAATYRVRLDVEVRVHADGRVEVAEITPHSDADDAPAAVWAGAKTGPPGGGRGSKNEPPTGNSGSKNDPHPNGSGSKIDPLEDQKLIRSLNGKDIQKKDQGKTTATATPAGETVEDDAVVAVADPMAPILAWIGFDDALSPQERAAMTVSDLLAWAYWVKLKQVERDGRVYNPVGLVRAAWRKGQPPRADLQRLARGWVLMRADGQRALLDRLEWADGRIALEHDEEFGQDFPDIPPTLATAVYAATGGELGPPALMPPPAEPRVDVDPLPAPAPNGGGAGATRPDDDRLWKDALGELEHQMTKGTYTSWLQGSTATREGDALTVHLRNDYAVEWVSNRLHDLVRHAVAAQAGRPIEVRYNTLTEAFPERTGAPAFEVAR